MSGKIIILDANGDRYVPVANTAVQASGHDLDIVEKALYSPVVQDAFDADCGTTGVADYSSDGGSMACAESFVPGSIDSPFDICLQVARGHLYLYLS